MEEYKPNSYSYKSSIKEEPKEEKKLQPVVTTPVKVKKKSEIGSKLLDIVKDILIPAAKKTLSDIMTSALDVVLYGNEGVRGGNNNMSGRYYSYASYYDRRPVQGTARQSRPQYSYDEIILATRQEAESVLAGLDDTIRKYGRATVADLYDLVGITGQYTDNNYGWTDLRSANVSHYRDGYLLNLPKPMSVDD